MDTVPPIHSPAAGSPNPLADPSGLVTWLEWLFDRWDALDPALRPTMVHLDQDLLARLADQYAVSPTLREWFIWFGERWNANDDGIALGDRLASDRPICLRLVQTLA